MVIQPSQNLRRLVNQIDIGFGIEVAEDLVRVFEHVQMLNLGRKTAEANRFFDCFSGTKVTCSRTGRENKHTPQHDATPVKAKSVADRVYTILREK